jgi:ATP-dependent Lhr-like helicase
MIPKTIHVKAIVPDIMEKIPWAGHIGTSLLPKVLEIIEQSASTLVFTNTRSQAEIWYKSILEAQAELAGQMALHHGSLSKEVRYWVEEALAEGRLKVVVSTSSLDLGVHFGPVETVIQIGSPKGVARFMQRAGRSGHSPGAESSIYFLPTHALELIEASALKKACADMAVEARIPPIRCFDVLAQWLLTLACGEGFTADTIFQQLEKVHCFQGIERYEFDQLLAFLCDGGKALAAYSDFKKLQQLPDNKFYLSDRRQQMRHRMSIGTIVSDTVLHVKTMGGAYIGTVEEWFVSKLKPNDVFWFAGRSLQLVQIRDLTVFVKPSTQKDGKFPSWAGGRMPLSSNLGAALRQSFSNALQEPMDEALMRLRPILELQAERSVIPNENQLLIESWQSNEGHHLFIFPFEGRFVHEAMAAVVARRLAEKKPLSITMAFNDYGFELKAAESIPHGFDELKAAFSTDRLSSDIWSSMNASEMAGRKFKDIASIAGLIFKGYPGKPMKDKNLIAGSRLFFEVFSEHEPDNLLLKQAYDEVLQLQIEENRLREALQRIQKQELCLVNTAKPSPLAFPLLSDRLNNEYMSTEKAEDKLQRILKKYS